MFITSELQTSVVPCIFILFIFSQSEIEHASLVIKIKSNDLQQNASI